MQKVYTSRQQMLQDLANYSNIDYEKTFSSRELAFVTKDGKEFWAPVWHLYIKNLIEQADAQLVAEGCQKYPRTYILLYKEQQEIKEVQKETKTDTDENKQEKSVTKNTRKSSK